jgi:GNAT superfamily N-acetyltransferase
VSTLAELIGRLEQGLFPAADLGLTVLPPPSDRASCVLGLTGHNVIAADVDPGWLAQELPPGDVAAPLGPAFLAALGQHTGRRAYGIDAMLLAPPVPPAETGLEPADGLDHPRLHRARRYRDDVHAWQDQYGGLVLLGRGLAGRLECAVEVGPDRQGRGDGRRLAHAARLLAPAGVAVWAQVTPGNAASLRAFLVAGFQPVGSEALLV